MVLDFYAFASAKHFFQQYTFNQMEPFTLIAWEQQQLYEFRWDGTKKHLHTPNPSLPHLWASSTLYPESIQQKRQHWFRNFLNQQSVYDSASIVHFHKTAGDGDPLNDLVMNRNNIVCTTSITMIEYHTGKLNMQYYDLLQQQSHNPEDRKNVVVDQA